MRPSALPFGLLPAFIAALWPAVVRAQEQPDDTPPSATPAPYVSVEEEVSPTYELEPGSSAMTIWRGQIPYDNGNFIFRVKFPIVTSAPPEAVTGAGDLALFDFATFAKGRGRWLAGLTVRVPTAQNSSLGSGKYSVGPAGGYEMKTGSWTLGFFSQNYFSVVGPSSRAPVGKTSIEPIVRFSLPRGWSVGLSSMSMTYDWVVNKWEEIPIGLRISKQFGRTLRLLSPFEASFEAEHSVSPVEGTPGWTTRLNVKCTF